MISVKGLYEWKLTDKKGNTIKEGQQWNMVTDFFFDEIAVVLYGGTGLLKDVCFKILLSDSIKDPAIDYREYGVSSALLNVIASGDFRSYFDRVLQKKWSDYNFSPPVGSPRTISTIGVSMGTYDGYELAGSNFFSFIELSTPITQNTDQYLYVKYTLYVNYQSGGMNVPSNRFVDYHLNSIIFDGVTNRFAQNRSGNADYNLTFSITPFRSPGDVNLIRRNLASRFSNAYTDVSEIGSRLSRRIESSIGVSSIPGIIGATANTFYLGTYGDFTRYICAGYSPTLNYLYPTVSRVFIHPESRISQIFSDPAYPPSSNGSIAISNYPTWTKAPVIGRVKITSTGDSASTDDEVFLDTAVNTGTEQITVAQNWPSGTRVRIVELAAP